VCVRPWYAQDAFLDVVRGNNGGYGAVQGFDPASGLGTFSNETFSVLLGRVVASKLQVLAARRDDPVIQVA
jgi:hypothetical protein